MFRNINMLIVGLVLWIATPGALNAATATSGTPTTSESHKGTATGSEVCVVSGEEIDKETNITYTYKDKVYRFCCTDCLDEFKKNPEKYSNKMNKQKNAKSE